jgi:hypothetical protein
MTSDFSGVVTAAAAVVSVFVSLFAVFLAYRVARRQAEAASENVRLQERLLHLEEARERDRRATMSRAGVTASIEDRGRADYRLVVRNQGEATAREIRVTIDGVPVLEHPLVPRGVKEVRTLASGVEAPYLLAFSHGRSPILDVRIEWIDDSGVPGRWASELKLF